RRRPHLDEGERDHRHAAGGVSDRRRRRGHGSLVHGCERLPLRPLSLRKRCLRFRRRRALGGVPRQLDHLQPPDDRDERDALPTRPRRPEGEHDEVGRDRFVRPGHRHRCVQLDPVGDRMIARLRHLGARREEGMALIVAVLILAVVSISAAAAISYTTIGQQDAASKKVGTSAYALAQAGLSNAMAQLLSHYYDSSGQPKDYTTSLNTMASTWAPSGSQQTPTSSAACTSSSTCVSWSGVLNCPVGVTCVGGSTITVSGVEKAVWHLTATGKAKNPSAPGLLTRSITVDVPVNATPQPVSPPDILKSVY